MRQILRYPTSLKRFCLKIIVDNIDTKYQVPYTASSNDITEENKPNFGPFGDQESTVLISIIEELVKREELRCEHLKILLPRETVSLTCDENTEFSLFQLDTIKLIYKRCPDFQVLHHHCEIDVDDISELERVKLTSALKFAVLQLKSLRNINLSDTPIDEQLIRAISTNCPNLNYLNLSQTNFCEGLKFMFDEESVIKNSLTTLIIDKTRVTAQSVRECLINLRNLTHFQYDQTIQACLKLFEEIRNSKQLDAVPEFKTIIFKSSMNDIDIERLTPEFLRWLISKFPKVKHLILLSLDEEIHTDLVITLVTWEYITHLELSSHKWEEDYDFSELESVLESCNEKLITLKLESFINVDIFYLGDLFRKLEKLSLINCTFLNKEKRRTFKILKELDIIFFKYCFHMQEEQDYLEIKELQYEDWIFILSSKTLEKIFVYDQSCFRCDVIESTIQMRLLKNLKEMVVFICPIRISDIMKLINEINKIKMIVVGFCPFIRIEDAQKILNFIKEKNLDISFLNSKEIPYYLRWLVLDIDNPI